MASTLVVASVISPSLTVAQSLEDQVEAYLEPFVATNNFSGSVLIAQKGEVLLSRGYGYADVAREVPNTPHSVFHLASVSRQFTSAAILLLQQRGFLSVDDPLSKYLPDWPRGDEITIHHLLTLSAGFPNINSISGYDALLRRPQTPATLAGRFQNLPLEFEPGSTTVHSNSNYVVLALLVETISGMSFGDFLRDDLFLPLGMSRTAHHVDADAPIPDEAIGYSLVGLSELEPAREIDWSGKAGHGSIYATTEDLYRFDRALVEGSLLNDASVAALFTEHFPRNGYGWFVGERFGSREVYLNGRSPGFGTYWGRSVNEDVTVIVLGNLYSSMPNTIGRDLLALALGQPTEAATLKIDAPNPELLDAIVGSYEFGPDFYRPNGSVSFQVRDGHLFNRGDWVMPTEGDELHFVHRRYGSDLVFVRGDDGHIVELHYDEYVGRKQ